MLNTFINTFIYKGHDSALVEKEDSAYDEITEYIDSRYVSAVEACWRLLTYPMYGTSHVIIN